MKKTAFVLFLLLFALTSSASAIGIRGALVLSNSNLTEDINGVGTHKTDLYMHYGLEIDLCLPVNPLMDIHGGLTYYFPVGGSGSEWPSDSTVAFVPVSLAVVFNIPLIGITGVNPYAGLGLNYTTWTFDPARSESPTPGMGYYGFIGASFGNLFGELGYTIMTGSMFDDETKMESRGIYVKGGMVLGI
ncbi:MAG: hypothetical protein NT030_04980 [Candidatus Saganbacteria bacterium]|nr:hypothetical protein [Candidatus Saganbacteria bacterium]